MVILKDQELLAILATEKGSKPTTSYNNSKFIEICVYIYVLPYTKSKSDYRFWKACASSLRSSLYVLYFKPAHDSNIDSS